MFNFTHVLNATTGERYYIDRATLVNDDGYDESPNGANWFEIDLQPEDPDGIPIIGIDLIVYNNGYAAGITKNLDPSIRLLERKSDRASSANAVDALIEGKTLIIINQ